MNWCFMLLQEIKKIKNIFKRGPKYFFDDDLKVSLGIETSEIEKVEKKANEEKIAQLVKDQKSFYSVKLFLDTKKKRRLPKPTVESIEEYGYLAAQYVVGDARNVHSKMRSRWNFGMDNLRTDYATYLINGLENLICLSPSLLQENMRNNFLYHYHQNQGGYLTRMKQMLHQSSQIPLHLLKNIINLRCVYL